MALIVLIGVALAGLWTQRRQIAADYIDRELERRGVEARYVIDDLGLGKQRLENVVIGDPANPDLTADWIELQMSYGLRVPRVSSVKARGVRLRGRIVNGKLSLGEIDKLLPPPSGAPFALPDIHLDLADAAMRLDTPAGRVGLALAGHGKLSGGFKGRAAASAPQLQFGRCTARAVSAGVAVSISDRKPSLNGPMRADRIACATDLEAQAPAIDVDVTLASTLDSWTGKADVASGRLRSGSTRVESLGGRLSFDGNAALTKGRYALHSIDARAGDLFGRRVAAEGAYQASLSGGRLVATGRASGTGLAAGRSVAPILASLGSASGTPLEPFGRALAEALAAASRQLEASGEFELDASQRGTSFALAGAEVASRSGARVSISGGNGLRIEGGRTRFDGRLSLAGGGFPDVQASFRESRMGGAIEGTAVVRPYVVSGARLALAPIQFGSGSAGVTRISTAAQVDGPFSGGSVRGLRLPIEGWFGRDGFALGERCTPLAMDALRYGSLTLTGTRLGLCPVGQALVSSGPGGLRGAATVANVRLAGRLGSSPLTLSSQKVRFDIGDRGFQSSKVAVRLGAAGYVNRLDLENISGRFGGTGLSGGFEGASGKIANVPLLLSRGRGRWQVAGGKAVLDGSVLVSDEASPARFEPLRSDDFHLTLVNSRIAAKGWLKDPETGTRVLQADIAHDLGRGAGRAILDVPGVLFSETFQPEQLTRLTLGVVALVRGELKGRGEIAWTRQGTTSTGTFSTTDMDLAAPFGPVTDLSTTIQFSDLLGLATRPDQEAVVERVQTGIDVFDGRVRYQLLPGLKVRVQAGSWPFAGGRLELEETILDFSQESAKRLTFRVVGMDAAAFVEQMQFSNISATGTFDGVVPMIFDQSGGRIVRGYLSARPAGGNVSYIGELTEAQLGAYGKLAFDALKSMRYSKLTVTLDGALDGEFVAGVELDGIARDAPNPGGITGHALRQLSKIPFEFNIVARGPFRAIIGTMRSLKDPSGLIQQVLPEEIRDKPTNLRVQPKESDSVP